LLVATVLGISFVIGAGCVFNNYIDRGIDEKMQRTKNRALVKKTISVRNALIFGSLLGLFGFALLFFLTNPLTAFVAFVGFFFYVVMYSIWKRRSMYGTLVGSISGAVPPVVGYCAVSNRFDAGAVILFLILVFWQMPHFYAIAIFRLKDYAAASIPVLPVKKGILQTKIYMMIYIAAFFIAAASLSVFHYTGMVYLVAASALCSYWLFLASKGFWVDNDIAWARKMFGTSLIILTFLSILMSIDVVVPKS
jgi:heme o synthase